VPDKIRHPARKGRKERRSFLKKRTKKLLLLLARWPEIRDDQCPFLASFL